VVVVQDVEKTIGMFGKKAKEGQMALEDMAGGETRRDPLFAATHQLLSHNYV
jgi:hypothetical protein